MACDGCGALLIQRRLLAELLGGAIEVEDDTVTERRCPCCSGRLRLCRLTVDGVELEHDTLRCGSDGIWLAGGLLEHILHAQIRDSHRDFPAPSFAAPGELDVEKAERREELALKLREIAHLAYLGLGFLLSLVAVFTVGWWCVATMVVAAVLFRWLLDRAKRLSPREQALAHLREQVASNLLVN